MTTTTHQFSPHQVNFEAISDILLSQVFQITLQACNFSPMEPIQQLFLLYKNMDKKREFIIDRDVDIFYPNFSIGIVSQSKEKLDELRLYVLETFTTLHTHFGQFGLVKPLS